MQVERTRRFQKAYRRLSQQDRQRVDEAIRQFLTDPLYPSLNVERIKGTKNKWSFRASGGLRCTFEFDGGLQDFRSTLVVSLSNVGHHDVYRVP